MATDRVYYHGEACMLKQRTICIILYGIIIISAGYPDIMRDFFPADINHPLVSQYIKEIEITDNSQIQYEYEYIFDFLSREIEAHERNIKNHYGQTSLNALLPELENGKLIINEVVRKRKFVDNETRLTYEQLDIDVFVESFNFAIGISAYNALVDFWFEKTGIILREKYDYEKETDRLRNFYLSQDKNMETTYFSSAEEFKEFLQKELGEEMMEYIKEIFD
jgi:hypothetical protein